jgi:DNA excision repair protein ERCC-4
MRFKYKERRNPQGTESIFLPVIDRREPVVAPFTIAIDNKEKLPYTFEGYKADKKDDNRPLTVWRAWGHLATGDYSLEGFEGSITIERKTLADLYGTMGKGRDRFEREHERMAEFDYAAVVVEASWDEIRKGVSRSRLNPETVWRAALTWAMRYGVHWYAFGDRATAEEATLRILWRYWNNQQKKKEEKQ